MDDAKEPVHREGRPFTVKELAAHLGLHPQTIYMLTASGSIRKIRGIGRKVLIPDTEAQRLARGE